MSFGATRPTTTASSTACGARMKASRSRDQTVRRAASGSSRRPPSESATSAPMVPKLSSRRVGETGSPRADSSTACSNAKNPPAKTSAGLQAKSSTRRSQRLLNARRMPVPAITPAAPRGRGVPVHGL
jgi:hypothetical protein